MLSKAVKRLPMVVFVVPPDSWAHTCNVADSGIVSAAGTDTETVEGERGHAVTIVHNIMSTTNHYHYQ